MSDYWKAAAILALMALFLVGLADYSRGHDAGGWHYPSICCGQGDCAVVEWEGEVDGEKVVNTKLHSGVKWKGQENTYFFSSPDGKLHLCATPDKAMFPGAKRTVYCLFGTAGM